MFFEGSMSAQAQESWGRKCEWGAIGRKCESCESGDETGGRPVKFF